MGVRSLLAASLLLLAAPAGTQEPSTAPAALVRASMPFPGEPGVTLEFLAGGDRAAFRATGRFTGFQPVISASQLLAILGDPRAEPLWAAILEWAGPDLALFRDRLVAQSRRSWEAGVSTRPAGQMSESVARGRARSLMQYALALHAAGQTEEAIGLLDRERALLDRSDDWNAIEWTLMSIRMASLRRETGDVAGAIGGLRADAATLGEANGYTLNLHVNRAAFLAEAGRHAEALALVDLGAATFAGKRANGDRVPGSGREFGWIRACALHGLGRAAEAREALRPVARAGEPSDRQWLLTPTITIKARAFRCMRDADGLAATVAEGLKQSMLGTVNLLQPGLRDPDYPPALLAAVHADPRVRAAAAGRFRPLPAALEPALNGWRAR